MRSPGGASCAGGVGVGVAAGAGGVGIGFAAGAGGVGIGFAAAGRAGGVGVGFAAAGRAGGVGVGFAAAGRATGRAGVGFAAGAAVAGLAPDTRRTGARFAGFFLIAVAFLRGAGFLTAAVFLRGAGFAAGVFLRIALALPLAALLVAMFSLPKGSPVKKNGTPGAHDRPAAADFQALCVRIACWAEPLVEAVGILGPRPDASRIGELPPSRTVR